MEKNLDLLRDWFLTEQSENEKGTVHREPDEELRFYQAVAAGDISAVEKNIAERRFVAENGVGTLSLNPVRNLKYHFVVTAAFITRLSIGSGLPAEQAFRLSDFYIRRADIQETVEGVENLHDEMVLDFTRRVQELRCRAGQSHAIRVAIDYIYRHLADNTTLKQLSEITELSEGYLSRQFHKELGRTITAYINERRLERSRTMLLYSDESIQKIAVENGFTSHSRFTEYFKKEYGVTPKEFRKTRKASNQDAPAIDLYPL